MHGGRATVEGTAMDIESDRQTCGAVDSCRTEDVDAQAILSEWLGRALESLSRTDWAKIEGLEGFI